MRSRDARVIISGHRLLLVSAGTSPRVDDRRPLESLDLPGEEDPLEHLAQVIAPGSHVTIVPDLTDDMDTRMAEEVPGVTSRVNPRKRRASREGRVERKQRKLADDPAGAGRRKRRESAAFGRRVKQRPA